MFSLFTTEYPPQKGKNLVQQSTKHAQGNAYQTVTDWILRIHLFKNFLHQALSTVGKTDKLSLGSKNATRFGKACDF